MSDKPPNFWSDSSPDSAPVPKHGANDPRMVADRGVTDRRHVDYSFELLGTRLAEQAASESELLKNLQGYLYSDKVKSENHAEVLIRSAFKVFSEIQRIRDPDYTWFWTSSLIEEYKQRQGKDVSFRAKEFAEQFLQKQSEDKRRRREEKARQLELHRLRDKISLRHKNDDSRPNLQLPKSFEPFPHIKQNRPEEYEKALKAFDDYQKVKFFEPYYKKLNNAARVAGLVLDDQGDVKLSPPDDKHGKEKLLDLFESDRFKQTVDELLTELEKKPWLSSEETAWANRGKILVGEDAEFLLGIAQELHSIHTLIKNEQLVGKSGKDREEKRLKRKILLLMEYKAIDLARENPGTDSLNWKNWLVYQYPRFERKFEKWSNYQGMEEDLKRGFGPSKRKAPEVWPPGHSFE